MRCAIYARYSSDMQRATSIDDQMATARRYAEQQGWRIAEAHVYRDEGISGASLKGRPGIQALLAAAGARPRPFDVLLVDDSSRVARDLADAVRFVQQLRFIGIRVIYISQQIDSADEQADTMVAVHGIVDGLYLREMAKKIRRGLAGQLQRGYATGGRTFGYRTTPVLDPSGRLDSTGRPAVLGFEIAVEPEAAATVREVFERYAAGAGIGSIVEALNRAGTPGPLARGWRYGAVKRILGNERYRGLQVWGQTSQQRAPGSSQKVTRRRPKDEWVTRERPDLRIVSDDLWARVQRRLQQQGAGLRRQAGSNLLRGRQMTTHATHLFSGVMRCGVCGGAMAIVTGGHGSPRYGCRRSWRHGVSLCTNRMSVRAKVVEPLLLTELGRRLTELDTVAYLTEAVSARVAKALDTAPKQRRQLEAARAATERKLRNLLATVENDGGTPSLLHAIRTREAELAAIDQDLATAPSDLAQKLTVLPSWVAQQVSDVAGLLHENAEATRAQFQKLGLSFTVTPVMDTDRPFLRAVGTANLLESLFGGEHDFPASGRSRPPAEP